MKINCQELLKALEIVKPGLASKEMIEQSTYFAFINGRVATYNDEISISHPIGDLELSGAIEAEKFYRFLVKLGSVGTKEIDLEIKAGELILSIGKEKVGVPLKADVVLPLDNVSTQKDFKAIPKDLVQALEFCMFSCGKDTSRPILTCIHVRKDGAIEASDANRITRYIVSELPVPTFLIPAKSVQDLIRPSITKIASKKGWIHFGTEDGTIFSSRVYEDTFPPVDVLLKVEGNTIKLPKSLGGMLEKAEIFSKGDALLTQTIDITLESNKMKIWSGGLSGHYEAEANIRYNASPVSFSIHPVFLKEIVQRTQTCILGKNIMKFEGENWQHVVALMAK